MKITEINGNVISIGKTSITVKRDDGKTCGIVKNCIPFQTMTARDKFALKHLGLEASKNCIICDGEIYYLNNKRLESWINQQAHPEFFTAEKAKSEQQRATTVAIMQQHFPTESTINTCNVNCIKSHSGADVHIIGGSYIIYDSGYKSDYVCGSYEDTLEYAMSL